MDKRALKILLDAFWSPAGWKPDASRGPSAEDFEYAKSKGMMFEPQELDHHQAVNDLAATIQKLSRRRVADSFLASLSTRRLDWRSPLGSYAVFQHLPIHAPVETGKRCGICGIYLNQSNEDLNVINFERCKWGGVRHDQVSYALFDLQQFLGTETPQPNAEDGQIFRNIVAAIAAVPSETTSAALQAHFAKVIKSNKAERDVIVAILGFCGILGTREHPGFSDSFVSVKERSLPDRRFVDMPYPACWWEGKIGVNQFKLREYFAHVL